jgi:hypothetical protein
MDLILDVEGRSEGDSLTRDGVLTGRLSPQSLHRANSEYLTDALLLSVILDFVQN